MMQGGGRLSNNYCLYETEIIQEYSSPPVHYRAGGCVKQASAGQAKCLPDHVEAIQRALAMCALDAV
jgi:hypothetical protein